MQRCIHRLEVPHVDRLPGHAPWLKHLFQDVAQAVVHVRGQQYVVPGGCGKAAATQQKTHGKHVSERLVVVVVVVATRFQTYCGAACRMAEAAAMPVAKASASLPPSILAIHLSKASRVGLPTRL